MTSATQNVVVFGGTGNQGSAFVTALAAYNTEPAHPRFAIFVLNRSPGSRASTRLGALPGVHLVTASKDYADHPLEALEATGLGKGNVYGLFDVQGYLTEDKDEAQGKGVVDAAVAWGVKHFIYASVEHDDMVETGNEGFDSKRRVERYIKQHPQLGYTMLRSTDFMDNWIPTSTFELKVYRTILLHNTFRRDPAARLQMVSTRDIGRAGARALAEPDQFMNTHIPLTGDALSMDQVRETYRRVMGEDVQETYRILGTLTKWMMPHVARLSNFYDKGGYTIPEGETAKVLRDVESFEAFLQRYKREHAT